MLPLFYLHAVKCQSMHISELLFEHPLLLVEWSNDVIADTTLFFLRNQKLMSTFKASFEGFVFAVLSAMSEPHETQVSKVWD